MFCSYLEGVALAYVPSESHVQSRLFEQVVYQGRGGGLAVAACYADFPCGVVSSGKLYLRNDMYAGIGNLFHYGGGQRDARTLYHFVGIEDLLLSVLPALVWDFPFFEHCSIFRCYFTLVGKEYVEAFHFGEYGSSRAAFASTQYDYT